MSEKVHLSYAPPKGCALAVGGAAALVWVLMFSTFNHIGVVWAVCLLLVAIVLIVLGLATSYRAAPPGGDTSEAWALTTDAIWHRKGAHGRWEPLVSVGSIRRVETGIDDPRWVGSDKGATLRIVDERGATYDVGPVQSPLRWAPLIVEAGGRFGAQIEAYQYPWVARLERLEPRSADRLPPD